MLTNSFNSACNLNTLRLWDLDKNRCITNFMGPFSCVWAVAVDWEKKEVLTSGDEGLKLWDLEVGAAIEAGESFVDKGEHRAVIMSC